MNHRSAPWTRCAPSWTAHRRSTFLPPQAPANATNGLHRCCAACAITSSSGLIVGSSCAICGASVACRAHMTRLVLRDMIDQFPFHILGFHSDGGTEYINHEVAKMLEKQRIDFTRSRPRRCNDNALAESKNGNVVRRQFGYSHIPAEWAKQFNVFCVELLNPFLNFHRPCLFGTEVPDAKKPGRTRR